MKGKKIDIEVARVVFADGGCELLEEQYQNNSTHMRYRCSCGCKSTISLANFKNGCRCKQCGFARANAKKRFRHSDVKKFFEKEDCELLEEVYRNNYTPMKYRCSCGNESEIRLFAFLKGQRCDGCDGGRGKTHYNWNPNREEVENNRKFARRSRHMLKYVLSLIGKEKSNRTHAMLGYKSSELREHITSHPNWVSVKNDNWHIDHVFPIKAFLDYGIEDVSLINCLENLQPMLAKDNLFKNASYDKREFKKWLEKFK